MVDAVKKIEDEITMIRERTDFAAMLTLMGVQSSPDETIKGYKKTTIHKILQGIHTKWTDDMDADRHLLRRILYTQYHLQSG